MFCRLKKYFVLFIFIITSSCVYAYFCSNCGKKIDDKAKFCSECGFSLNNSTPNEKQDSDNYFTSKSALEYVEEQLVYFQALPLVTISTEYAKFLVKREKIFKCALDEDQINLKADYAPVILISHLLDEMLAPHFGSVDMTMKWYRIYWYRFMKIHDFILSKRGLFNLYKTADFLTDGFKVTEKKDYIVDENGKKKTGARHAEFVFAHELRIQNYDYVMIILLSHPNYDEKPFDYADMRMIPKRDFINNNTILLKNISVYGTGVKRFIVGLRN